MGDTPSGAFAVTLLGDGGGGVRVEWDRERLVALAAPAADAPPESPWELASGAPDWQRWSALRVVSAAFGGGAMLALAALRPAGAEGHGDDLLGGAIVRDDVAVPLAEVLLSAQLDGEGEIKRINVEAYESPDSVPLRAAGDRQASSSGDAAVGTLTVTVLAMRMDGQDGFGTIDVLTSP